MSKAPQLEQRSGSHLARPNCDCSQPIFCVWQQQNETVSAQLPRQQSGPLLPMSRFHWPLLLVRLRVAATVCVWLAQCHCHFHQTTQKKKPNNLHSHFEFCLCPRLPVIHMNKIMHFRVISEIQRERSSYISLVLLGCLLVWTHTSPKPTQQYSKSVHRQQE